MAVASLVECQRAVTSAINAGTASTWGVTLNDQRFSAGEIQHAIVSADSDVVHAILNSPKNPFRAGLMQASSTLSNGDEIPDSTGEYGPVEIDIAGTDSWVVGSPTNLDDIEMMRRNPNNMFGATLHNQAGSPLGGYYHILHPKIYFTGTSARVWIGSFTPNYTSPACAAPEQYTPAIVQGAVSRLLKEGYRTPEVFMSAQRRFEMYLQMIAGGAGVLPQIELTQKAIG